jgi:hypothetical protein
MRPRRRALLALATACAALALAGCAAAGPTYSVLDREAEAADAVPGDLPAQAGDGADLDSARVVGEHEGSSLWLMRGDEPGTICLLSHRDDGAWIVVCSDEGTGLQTEGETGHFAVVPDGAPGPEGTSQVSENVYAY